MTGHRTSAEKVDAEGLEILRCARPPVHAYGVGPDHQEPNVSGE
jgi:hypothetical protein